MNRRRTILATLLVAALSTTATPALAGHGTWGAVSQNDEPNTKWDTPAYMQQRPNQAAVEKVYFNGLIIKDSLVALNPYEVQVADGNVMGPEGYFFAAVLGFWRDCNRDGYIGAKNTPGTLGNFHVYPRAGYTIDETICPTGSPYAPRNRATSGADGWIDELRWIGIGAGWDPYEYQAWVNSCANPPSAIKQVQCVIGATGEGGPGDVTDNRSRVWADWGFPGASHIPFQGLTGGHPPGTYSDSDGTLKYVDDASAQTFSGALGAAWDTKPNIGDCGGPGVTPELGGGPDNTCGLWPLYQVKRLVNDGDAHLGTEDEPQPLVNVFDTENDAGANGNPCDDFVSAGAGPAWVALADPNPSVHPNFLVEGSLVGTVANVQAGVNATRTSGGAPGTCGSGESATGNLESSEQDAEYTHRQPDEWLNFTRDQRWHYLDSQGFQDMPSDVAGVYGGITGFGTNSPGWFGQVGWTPRPPRHGWGSVSTAYATFYADVTTQAFTNAGLGASPAASLPGATQDRFTYGVPEYCPSITTGTSNVNPANQWECSRAVWLAKRTLDGAAASPRALLGDRYDLRDVDCFDNTVSYSLAPDVHLGAGADCTGIHQ